MTNCHHFQGMSIMNKLVSSMKNVDERLFDERYCIKVGKNGIRVVR